MKKYILLCLILSGTLMLGSCDDFLDKPEEGKVPTENIDYTDKSKMFEPVSGIYAQARTENGFSRWVLLGLIAIRADDVVKGNTDSNQGELDYCKGFKYDQVQAYWGLNGTWEGLYSLIEKCTGNLDVLDRYKEHLTASDDIKLNNQYQAEVRFIRAYTYFFVTRLWGDVPVFQKSEDLLGELAKTPRADVYKFLNEELDYCIENLPEKRPNEMPYKGQVTKYTALALKAKVNSDINDWDAVLDATQKVIDSKKFSLFGDYYKYFKKDGRLADETLFELQYTDATAEPIQSDNWFAFQGPDKITGGTKTMGNGWNFLPATDEIVDLFVSRGETDRYKTTFLIRGTTTPDGDIIEASNIYKAYSGKAYLPSSQLKDGVSSYGAGNNIRMLRYADVLLLNAEAKVRKGQNGDGPFNEVRDRAKMSQITNVTLAEILEERRVEFAMEWGERFFDLVRTKEAKNVLSGFVEGEHEFYPIPQSQIDKNPLLDIKL